MRDTSLSRRRFLTMAGGAAVVAGSSGLLAACGGGTSTPAAAGGPGSVKLPDYIPYELVKPDVPATADGVMAAYYNYPRDLVDAFKDKPGKGAGEVSVFTNMFNPVPPGVGSNSYWQQLNDRVGATLNITMTPAGDYPNKLSTVIAGGDLPDLVMISAKLANRSEMLTRLCADLTEHLSGGAVKDYPFLANIPTDSWVSTVYGGGIFAVPIPRGIAGRIMLSRRDIINQRSLNETPGSFDEFRELARGLTDERGGKWAFGSAPGVVTFVGDMLGVPNEWREEGGKFTNEVETEERKRAVGIVADLAKEGLFHPDALGGKLQLRDLFGNGTIALVVDGYAAWDILANTYSVDVGGIPEPGFDGGEGSHRAGAASFALTALKKTDKSRVEQLLRICDWLATPLGTSEYMFRKFGVEGTHYKWENGEPVPTTTGDTEVKLPLEYVTDAPHVLGPGPRERVDRQRSYQEKVIPHLLRNPAEGLYSKTSLSKNGQLTKIIDTAELDIISGRKPLDTWDEAVTRWKASGGDQMRREYETAFAERN
jgi:putative aldouronate transport system substrate-binding protein